MKYSLRSLMIVVTLACVAFGRIAQNKHMAAFHEAAVQGLADQLGEEQFVFYYGSIHPNSADEIRDQIKWIVIGDCPVRIRNDHDKLLLICVCEGIVLVCDNEKAVELMLSAIQHEQNAMAYRAAIWKPWRLSIEPPQMRVIRE